MYSKILLASDGSAHAYRAAKKVLYLNTENHSKVTLLYVIDPDKYYKDLGSKQLNESFITKKRQDKLQLTEKLLNQYGIAYDVEIVKGDPEVEIIKFLKYRPHDILVMGSRGLNTLQKMVLGSVSHKVMKTANCPVLIVK
ncbi:hypothetical protein ACA30_13800 [Virgibacillus soli]|nr:hypothetical protein ACA30_13800 [Virgibacillus soli]